MSNLVKDRLNRFKPSNVRHKKQVLREISQEIMLASLAQNNFFDIAEFHGGTALRICYDLNRFSEDPYFALLEPK